MPYHFNHCEGLRWHATMDNAFRGPCPTVPKHHANGGAGSPRRQDSTFQELPHLRHKDGLVRHWPPRRISHYARYSLLLKIFYKYCFITSSIRSYIISKQWDSNATPSVKALRSLYTYYHLLFIATWFPLLLMWKIWHLLLLFTVRGKLHKKHYNANNALSCVCI